MEAERCDECGFDGDDWSNNGALDAIGALPDRWAVAIDGIAPVDLVRRPIPDMWSIAEYVDHVREVLFGMRFVFDVAVSQPGTDLGPAPDSTFSPEPAPIDVAAALDRLGDEARQLRRGLAELDDDVWASTVGFDGETHDVDWIARHAVHDATHHLMDVERLREELAD